MLFVNVPDCYRFSKITKSESKSQRNPFQSLLPNHCYRFSKITKSESKSQRIAEYASTTYNCYRFSKITKSESKSQLARPDGQHGGIVTGSAKLQNLKANHNRIGEVLADELIVTGSAKLQNLKANHNKDAGVPVFSDNCYRFSKITKSESKSQRIW